MLIIVYLSMSMDWVGRVGQVGDSLIPGLRFFPLLFRLS